MIYFGIREYLWFDIDELVMSKLVIVLVVLEGFDSFNFKRYYLDFLDDFLGFI